MLIGPVLDSKTTCVAGLCIIDVLIPSKQNLPHCSWVLISRGLNQYASQPLDLEQFVAEETDRISYCEDNCRSQENPARIQTKHNHRVIKERRPVLTNQQSKMKAVPPKQSAIGGKSVVTYLDFTQR